MARQPWVRRILIGTALEGRRSSARGIALQFLHLCNGFLALGDQILSPALQDQGLFAVKRRCQVLIDRSYPLGEIVVSSLKLVRGDCGVGPRADAAAWPS